MAFTTLSAPLFLAVVSPVGLPPAPLLVTPPFPEEWWQRLEWEEEESSELDESSEWEQLPDPLQAAECDELSEWEQLLDPRQAAAEREKLSEWVQLPDPRQAARWEQLSERVQLPDPRQAVDHNPAGDLDCNDNRFKCSWCCIDCMNRLPRSISLRFQCNSCGRWGQATCNCGQ
jgi:hypothetical protein